MAERFPWLPPIRNFGRVWRTESHFENGGGSVIPDLTNQSFAVGQRQVIPAIIEDRGTNSQHQSYYVRNNVSVAGTVRDHGRTFDVGFELWEDGGFAGDILAQRLHNGYESEFVFDVTCPVGFDRFQWYLDGATNVNASQVSRYARIAVGRIQEPTSAGTWSQFLDDNRTFARNVPFSAFPPHWSAESNNVTFPISPGQTVRFYLNFIIVNDWTPSDNAWNANISVNFGMAFMSGSPPTHRFERDRSGQLHPLPDLRAMLSGGYKDRSAES